MKNQIKKVYQKCVRSGSINLSGVNIVSGKELAREFRYPSDLLDKISDDQWKIFAACGNPWLGIRIEPGWTILDLGCGSGVDTIIAAQSLKGGGFVVGLDLVFDMLKTSKRLFGDFPYQEKAKAYFLNGEGECLPFKNEVFDLIVCNGVLSLLPDKKAGINEMYRTLKVGGQITICDLIRYSPLPEYFYEHGESWAWCMAGAPSKVELGNLLEESGFSSIKFTWGKPFHYFATASIIVTK